MVPLFSSTDSFPLKAHDISNLVADRWCTDHKLPNREEAADEPGDNHIPWQDNKHWHPSGMCALPSASLYSIPTAAKTSSLQPTSLQIT